ncbi:MAG: putative metal-binding motif-containing protein [Chitinophagales bacterium]
MKTKLLLLSLLFTSFGISLRAQCTPNASPCTGGAAVAPFGGLCDTVIPPAVVGTPYLGVLQFYISGICFDPTVLGVSVPIPGVTARISAINSIGFSQLPNGISSGTDQASYNIPFNATRMGCGYFAGTPTQAGVFGAQVAISGSYTTANCYFFTTSGTETINYTIDFTVLPNANFSGLAASYCTSNAAVTLNPTGTTGGTFSGPGVSGNTFNPALAGPGTHTITYTVSAQQGAAVAPATNSSSQQVVVNAASTYYADTDNDNFGDPTNSIVVCSGTAPTGYVANNLDCNDGNSNINPNGTEICDNIDNNCNAQIDENLTLFTYYRDFDNDGFGDANTSIEICLSSAPAGYTVDSTDCNDALSSINPNATDIPGNGIDEDCDGSDATLVVDNDNDNYDNTVDCNDNNPAINPGATEVCDGVDNNCDGNIDEGLTQFTYYIDNDNDGYGSPSSSISSCASVAPAGYSANSLDCNDNNMNIHPNAAEVCDGIDNDCDGFVDNGLPLNSYYLDADFDGFGSPDSSINVCNATAPAGYSVNSLDCNDGDINIHPNLPRKFA